ETARLSFVSSSTGYSSARSSLRSSDGGDETNNNGNRDSAISTSYSLSSQSSVRRSDLLLKGILTQLDRIAIELLDTERTYVDDLNAIIKGYMDYLVEEREKLKVTLDAISSLFGCIEKIFAFNKQLYNQLDAANLDCVKVCLWDAYLLRDNNM
uniref:DH domain-containing protein n=2 Tax=Caenorhabditis japonica TaxID=281687 RepID=A0A8R1ETI9_CAEJA